MNFIECVPNFSEGRDEKSIAAIVSSIESIENVYLLGKESSWGANRSVLTFAGAPEDVFNAALNAYKTANNLIDMTRQKGAHPRIGALDVCPFIPLNFDKSLVAKEEKMETCINLARKLANEVSERFDVPVYLYGEAAKDAKRMGLPLIRKGQYEGLKNRIADENFIPDFWSGKFNESFGATAIGARDILIAYNVTLDTNDIEIAKNIARQVKVLATPKKCLRALGWYIDEYEKCQVSMNILNFRTLPVNYVYELVANEALSLGIKTLGSELVGLAPLKALTSSEMSLEETIEHLGLNYHYNFEPSEKILDFVLAARANQSDLPEIE